MNSNKSIEQLHRIIKSKFGEREANKAVKDMIGNVLYDLEQEGLEVTEKNLSEKFTQYVDDFAKATKTEVA